MKSLTVVLTTVLFVLEFVVLSSVDGMSMGADGSVQCKGIDIKVQEEHMMSIKECMKALKVETIMDLGPENAGCFSKCVMEKYALVDGSGKPHKENIMNAIDKNLPPALIEVWKVEMGKCLDDEGMQIKSPDDESCSSYFPLAICTHMAFLKICKA